MSCSDLDIFCLTFPLSILPLLQLDQTSLNYRLTFHSPPHPPTGVLLRKKWSILIKSKGKVSDSTRYAYLLHSLGCHHPSSDGETKSGDKATKKNDDVNENERHSGGKLGNKTDSEYFNDFDTDIGGYGSDGKGSVAEEREGGERREDEYSAISLELLNILVGEFQSSISDDCKNVFSLSYSNTSPSSFPSSSSSSSSSTLFGSSSCNLPTDLLARIPLKGACCDNLVISVSSFFLTCLHLII